MKKDLNKKAIKNGLEKLGAAIASGRIKLFSKSGYKTQIASDIANLITDLNLSTNQRRLTMTKGKNKPAKEKKKPKTITVAVKKTKKAIKKAKK